MATADALAAALELSGPQEMSALEQIVMAPETDADAIGVKESAIMKLGELYAEAKLADKLTAMVVALRPYFSICPKAKTAKIVRMLIDSLAKIPARGT